MITRALQIISIGIFVLMLAVPASAQNTKGDKPVQNRENRFKKTTKAKPAKRIRSNKRSTSSLRAYKPRKKSKGGERAGRATSPIRTSRPSERQSRNTYSRSGYPINNSSPRPRDPQRKNSTLRQRSTNARSASRRTRNVYPQASPYVNYSSTPQRPPKTRRKITPRSASRSFTARKSVNAWAHFPRPKQKKERAYKGDISGRKIRTKNYESKRPPIMRTPIGSARLGTPRNKNISSRSKRFLAPAKGRRPSNVYSRQGPYANMPPRSTQRSGSALGGLFSGQQSPDRKPGKRRVTPRSASGAHIARRSTNMWAHFPRPKHKGERAITTDIAGRPLRTKNFETKRPLVQTNPTANPYKRKRKIGDQPYRSGAGRYATATRSGKGWRGDITHRRTRANYTSKKRVEGKVSTAPVAKRPGLDHLFRGRFRGGFRSRTAKRRLSTDPVPVRPPGLGVAGMGSYKGRIKRLEGQGKGFMDQGEGYTGYIKSRRPPKSGGSVSGKLWNNKTIPIDGRQPGIGGDGVGQYQGNIKWKRPQKGGGSVSGKLWNNKQTAIDGRQPGIGGDGVGQYQGNIKWKRPQKGGGSVSGKLWNNNRAAIDGRVPAKRARGVGNFKGNIKRLEGQGKGFMDQGEGYTGYIKSRRPPKGGGSVSGRLWNNKRTAIDGRQPGIGGDGVGEYQGNIKWKRPSKGGGSVSGKLWNNKQTPIDGRQPGIGGDGVGEYQGNIKWKRPSKGGGSVSGKLWNNKQTPINVRIPKEDQGGEYQGNIKQKHPGPSRQAAKASGFPGKIRQFDQSPGFNDQGEEYTGNIKARRPPKGGGSVSGKLWNNKEKPIHVRIPVEDQGGEYSGNLKLKKGYVKNPNTAEEGLKKRRPPTTYLADGLQVKVRQRPYGNRKDAPEGSIPGIKPTRETVRASEYARGVRQNWKYIRNPNSSEDAIKVREPGKAFARASDYQGNIKMKKFDLFGKRGLHPDAQFVKTNKNNVASEKDMMTNFKLWWSRLFKKNDTLPSHLKDRHGKPRYDKSEQGMWYD